MQRTLLICFLTALMLAAALPVLAGEDQPAASLGEAITKGTPLFSLRYRFEEVDQADMDLKAHASTMRTTVGYKTLAYKGISFLVEAEDVTVWGNPRAYDNVGFEHLNNNVDDRPKVADPALTEINQAYFQWKSPCGNNKAQVGREEIIIGDSRFVGNVGWRQNHQSFDAFTFTNTSLKMFDWSYRYVNKANLIVGRVHDMNSHLANVDVKFDGIGTLGLYGYMLDYTRSENYGNSRATLGGEFKGKVALNDDTKLLYELEYATQSDYGNNTGSVDASYMFLMGGVAFKPMTIKVGYEVLGGDDDDSIDNKGSFATPLATLHKFNGWADKFLKTPGAGLNDLYFLASGNIGPVKSVGAYHIFSTDAGGVDLGTELDLQFTYKTSWKQTFGLKGAFYSTKADEVIPGAAHSLDTNKFWAFTSFKI